MTSAMSTNCEECLQKESKKNDDVQVDLPTYKEEDLNQILPKFDE